MILSNPLFAPRSGPASNLLTVLRSTREASARESAHPCNQSGPFSPSDGGTAVPLSRLILLSEVI